ncbi:MAG TPA: NAD(P)H-dependent oxidoreductase [Sporosarcina sp.]|nr:NAD(P)H-dependent oxidoreductase [Sporosarcina sp.]
MKIGVLVGSNRTNSFSGSIAKNVMNLFPEETTVEIVKIDHLPFYNQDFDEEGTEVPEDVAAFRKQVASYDGFLFVTPEYNRSVPALLKNAIDMGSRPKSENVWGGKPAAIISHSPGLLGGFGANHHLRQTLTCLNMPIVQQPEVYLSNSAKLLGDKRIIENEGTVEFLQLFVNTFMDLLDKHL